MKKYSSETVGIVSLIITAFFFATFSLWARIIGNSFGPFFQAWSRSVVVLLFLVPIGLIYKSFRKIKKSDWIWLIIVAFGWAAGDAPFFLAVNHLPLSTALFLFYAGSTITSFLLGKIIFSEKITPPKLIALILALAGTFLIYKAEFVFNGFLYMLCGAFAGITFGVYATLSKKISGTYSNIQILTLSMIVSIGMSLMGSFIIGDIRSVNFFGSAWLANIGFALAILISGFLTVAGFKRVEAQKGSLVLLSELIFVLLIGYIFFDEVPTLLSIAGGLCIIIAFIIPNLNLLKSNNQ